MNELLIICGPTATGKTEAAIHLAKKFNGELISADSRQIYKGMDIGTGKDIFKRSKVKDQRLKIKIKNQRYELIPYDMDGIPLWMYDVVNPDEEFSVAHYQKLATVVIENVRKRRKLPIVVGGTGLYIQSLLSPIETSHIPPNNKLRTVLQALNTQELQERLKRESVSLLNNMNLSDRQNPRRLMRKIEIAEYERNKETKKQRDKGRKTENALIIGLTAPYTVLYKRIDQRVEKRFRKGIIQEIETLLSKGYLWDLQSMNTFGYKEWKEYFKMSNAKCQMLDKREMQRVIQRWKWDEHGYARRQMAWFRKMNRIQWVDITQDGWQRIVETIIQQWYTTNEREAVACPPTRLDSIPAKRAGGDPNKGIC